VHIDDVVEQVLPDVAPEEEAPLTNHVVQQEEAVRLLEEPDLPLLQREDLVVGTEKPDEAILEQGVRAVRERRAVP